MSLALHNLMSIMLSLLVLAAPALCMCGEQQPPKAAENTHQCCAHQQSDQQDQQQPQSSHSETCTHCGAQRVQPVSDHHPALDLMPLVMLPELLEIQPASPVQQPIDLRPNRTATTPVRLHTCSLT